MATYEAPLQDMEFLLGEVFDANELWASLDTAEQMNTELAGAILDEAGKMVESLLQPLNRSGDELGCHFDNGRVTTPDGFEQAFKTFAESGWPALSGNPEYGGQGAPKSLTVLFDEMMCSANTAFSLYPGLTTGTALALDVHAPEELKRIYLPKMYSGEWTGTMCLTEAHCGTDLGLMRTRAKPNDDGSYSISGTKIFITGGEHDLAGNIVHMVLAKLPDAPAGSRGISLFLVPKYLPDNDGNPGEFNNVSAGSIEHKMGIQGAATCVMNFDGAKGWLIGGPHQGLACMFTMMNYERLTIGIQGLALGEASYQNAAAYARERLQGRSLTGTKNPGGEADPIIVHGDIRRMLLTMRAFNESGRALAVYVGMALDKARFAKDPAVREKAKERVALLTPVVKAFLTDRGFEATVLGQQVFGGHGYIRENGVEQFVRDCRIAQIYEGTNGVQAMDLLGRKVARNGGQYVQAFISDMRLWIDEHSGQTSLEGTLQTLTDAIDLLERTTGEAIRQCGANPDAVSANAVEYLDLFGYVTCAWLWARMMAATAGRDDTFGHAKSITGRFYMARLLPRTHALAEQIAAGTDSIMGLDQNAF